SHRLNKKDMRFTCPQIDFEFVCVNGENVMPHLVEAAHAYVTLGEMTDVMRETFGLYQEPLHI
ncbi:MAG: hypothetical protein AAFN11_08425, partial [Chloroflexota bacterium]